MVDEAGADQPQPDISEQRVDRAGVEQERLKQEYDREALLGRGLFRCASERASQRLTPYTDTQRVPKDLLSKIATVSSETQLSGEDVKKAREASLGIALEFAAQISEARLSRTGGIREDLDSLSAMVAGIRKGDRLKAEYLGFDPRVVVEQTRGSVARRLRKPSEEVQWDDQRLIGWANEQFTRANTRLVRSAEALRGYLGR